MELVREVGCASANGLRASANGEWKLDEQSEYSVNKAISQLRSRGERDGIVIIARRRDCKSKRIME